MRKSALRVLAFANHSLMCKSVRLYAAKRIQRLQGQPVDGVGMTLPSIFILP
jgi:hypothetical protein